MHFYNSSLKWIRLIFSFLIVFAVAISIFSCSSGDDSTSTPLGEWYKESDFDGTVRSNAVLFMIGETPYLGSGFNQPQNTANGVFLKDFYAYSSNKTWKSISNDGFGSARSNAVAFALNGKGYVGLGFDGTNYLNDFYEYDPSLDKWTKIADFPGTPRYGSVAFVLDGKGYVGAGYDGNNYLKDLYAYDPTSGTWISKAGIGGAKRQNAFSFVIDNKAYVGGGRNSGGAMETTMWEYDAASDMWTEKNDLRDDKLDDDPNDKGYATIAREQAVTFVINGLGYVAGGSISSIPNPGVWEYNPTTDTWEAKNAFEGTNRTGAVGFTLGGRGYLLTGVSGTFRFDDMWSFDPTAVDIK